MIQTSGIRLGDISIPSFTVTEGEIVVIHIPNRSDFFALLFKLAALLTGVEKSDAVKLTQQFRFVDHVTESRWRSLLFPLTVKRYVKKFGNPDNNVAGQVFQIGGLEPNVNVSRLPGTPRKILSLLTTCSWTDKIVFDLAGIDPTGAQQVYDLVKSQIGHSGAAVLIDWTDDFKNDCSRFVEFELMVPVN